MLSLSRAVQQGASHRHDRPPPKPQQGVPLGHKSPGPLNHAPLAFLITVVHLHLYSIREINGSGHGAQVDILLWGT